MAFLVPLAWVHCLFLVTIEIGFILTLIVSIHVIELGLIGNEDFLKVKVGRLNFPCRVEKKTRWGDFRLKKN